MRRYRRTVGWHLDEFVQSLTAVSANTVAAYHRDVAAFAEWAGRAGIDDSAAVDRLLLRRYLAYLTTRRYARRTIARKTSALRRYFGWLRRTGLRGDDPSSTLHAPSGGGHPRARRHSVARHTGHRRWPAGREHSLGPGGRTDAVHPRELEAGRRGHGRRRQTRSAGHLRRGGRSHGLSLCWRA